MTRVAHIRGLGVPPERPRRRPAALRPATVCVAALERSGETPKPRNYTARRGAVLIVAMVVVFTLASLVLVLSRTMRVEAIASANRAAAVKAAAVERGAEQYVLALVAQEGAEVLQLPEEDFAGVPVGDGLFWVLRPDYGDPDQPVYGLVDESAKLDLNEADYDELLRLPGMTEDVASAIMEWKDEDSNVERSGPESEYYLSLPTPYYAKNANFETVEELLLVRGVTRQMLYGDGTAAPLGTGTLGRASDGTLTTDVWLSRGIGSLLTVYNVEQNVASDGSGRRVNIRSRDRQERERFVNLLRQKLEKTRADAVIATLPSRTGRDRYRDVFDFYFRAKLKPEEFDLLADSLTSDGDETVRGRINVNTAPREVLLTIEELQEADVDKLLAARGAPGSRQPGEIAWVADALGERAVGIGNDITTTASRYSADIVAASGNGRAFKRVRVVVDAAGGTPRIVYRRDMTPHGWPMDRQILAQLRAGMGPGQFGGGGGNGRRGGTGGTMMSSAAAAANGSGGWAR